MALTETIGIGKGSVAHHRLRRGRPDRRRRAEPGHQSPTHADRRWRTAKRQGATIVAINPLPEAGLHPVQEPATGERAVRRRAPQLADDHLPIRINGDLAFFKAVNHLLRHRAAMAPSTSPNFIDAVHERVRRFADDSAATFDWEHVHTRRPDSTATSPSGSRRASAGPSGSSSAGRWASPSTRTRWRRFARWSTSCCSRGNIGRPGCRRVPGARTLERAGRPDDGHLRDGPSTDVPRRAGRRVRRSSRRGRTASTPSTRSRRCATAT